VQNALVYALAPSLVEQMLAALRALPTDGRRMLGLAALALGLAMVWAAKALGA